MRRIFHNSFIILLIILFSFIAKANELVEVKNWQFLNYDIDSKIPLIKFKDNINLKKFKRYNVSRPYGKNNKISDIIISEGNAYFLDSMNKIVVFDLERKKVIKKYVLNDFKKDNATAIIKKDNIIYVAFSSGRIISFSLLSEMISWQATIPYPINSSMIIENNKLFLVASNTVYSLDIYSGNILWSVVSSNSGVSFYKSFAPTLYRGYLLVGLSTGNILVLNKEQGDVVFRSSNNNNFFQSLRNPLIGDIKSTVIGYGNSFIYANNDSISNFSLVNNKKVWKNREYGSYNNLIIYKDSIITIDNFNNIVSIDLKSGKTNWKRSIVAKKTSKRRLYWFGGVIVNDSILINSSMGEIQKLSLEDGSLKERGILYHSKKEKIVANAIMNSENILYLSSFGNLYLYQYKK